MSDQVSSLHIVRALGMDALAQVLDNKVFRILGGLCLLLVLIALCIGVREDGVVLLFGLKHWSFAEMGEAWAFLEEADDPQVMLVRILQAILVDGLGGYLGMMIAITSTAFFVPNMLERGTVDTLFSKPITRLAWYLSRYAAGVLFVFFLSTLLIGGVHLALLLNSGYSDPGFLWGIVTMTYGFSLVYAVVMLAGALTRSSVAALLLALFFWAGNGCVHNQWIEDEYEAFLSAQRAPAAEAVEEAEAESPELEPEPASKEPSSLARMWASTIRVAHFALPKTTDADYLAEMMREAMQSPPAFHDKDTGLILEELDEDWEATSGASALALPDALAEAWGSARYGARRADGAAWALYRRERGERPSMLGLELLERPSDIADELVAALEEAGRNPGEPERTSVAARSGARRFDWDTLEGAARGQAWVFVGSARTVWLLWAQPAQAGPDREEWESRFVSELVYEGDQEDFFGEPSAAWYQKRLGWSAPWRYNAFFSIGSSLAFTLLMLLLGWWKVARTDF